MFFIILFAVTQFFSIIWMATYDGLQISRYTVIMIVEVVCVIINKIMKEKKISKYQLAADSGIPYMTVSDICNGKTSLDNCNARTVYKLAEALGVTMERLIEPYMDRPSFDLFKSNVCHRVKTAGDIDFIIETLEDGDIDMYIEKEWYPEGLYLLAMVDYLSRINNVPLVTDYDKYRGLKLKKYVYPASIVAKALAFKDEKIKEDAVKNSIPEFIRFNIVENEIRNVV